LWLVLPVAALLVQPISPTYVIVVIASFVLLLIGLFGLAGLDPRLPAAGFVPVAMFAIYQATMRTLWDRAHWYTLGRALAAIILLSCASLAAVQWLGRRAFRT
jgi:hypothetical protein